MNFRQLTHVTLACAALGALTLVSCNKNEQGNAAQQAGQVPQLAVLTIGQDDATLQTGYPASLHGQNDVEIRPQVSGFITKVCVEEGQHVSAGQVLFTIDRVQLQAAVDAAKAQVGQAQAAVVAAQANVNTAQTNANNNKMLLDKNIISAPAYQTSVDALNAAKAQLAQAQAGLNAANSQLVSANKQLSYANVTAPTSGIVGTIDYKEGALVSPQTLLTVLSNNGQMEAYFSLNEKEVLAMTDNGRRSLDQAVAAMPPVELLLANGEVYPYKGKVISLSGVLDTKTGSAMAKAVFPNPDGMLRSGGTANVLIPNIAKDAIMVPQKATYEVQDMRYVFVLDDKNITHATPITVADENDGQNFIITSGLKPGDRIVVEGVGVSVKDQMPIKPKNGK